MRRRPRPRASPGRAAAAEERITLKDEVGEQLAGWGTVARLETRGRRTGRPIEVAVGYVEADDGSLLVAAGSEAVAWARNLEAEPRCVVTIGRDRWAALAERLEGGAASRAVTALILRYGTPAERLGGGPVFRLRRGRAEEGPAPGS